MKQEGNKKYFKLMCLGLLGVFATAGLASAAIVPYKAPKHVFSMDDVLGTWSGITYADDPSIICTNSTCPGEGPKLDPTTNEMIYPIDSDFAFDVLDFVGAERRDRDYIYEEGWITNIFDDLGSQYGVIVSSPETPYFKTGNPKGSWCLGLSNQMVKCGAEKYVVMEHILTCTEKVPYFYTDPYWDTICQPLSDTLFMPADPVNPVVPFYIPVN